MRVIVDSQRCASSGMCEQTVPDVFSVGPDGVLAVLQPDVDDSRRGELDEAVASCPTGALSLEAS